MKIRVQAKTDQGHQVSCAYMKNWINEDDIAGHCPWEEDIRDARAAAEALGLPFEVVNFIKDYRERVVKYLLEGYHSGITPNPDVMCNREMKFGVLLDYALSQGFEAVATGHYAVRRVSTNGGIRWDARWVNVTHTLGGEYVGLVEIDDGEWDMYFGPLRLGRFHERTYLVEDIHGRQRRRPSH